MTDKRIEEIKGRLAKATPGPWSTERPGVDPGTGFRNGCVIAAVGPRQAIYADPPGGSYPENDRKFIAHAWADIRDILDALKAETARADKAEAELRETYMDDNGTTWNRPTAWAYFSACRALTAANEKLAAARERDLRLIEWLCCLLDEVEPDDATKAQAVKFLDAFNTGDGNGR